MVLAYLFAVAVQTGPLQSTLAVAHRDYMAQLTDKFADTTVDPAVVGKPFKFVRSLTDGDAYTGGVGGAYYTYKDGKLRLIFTVNDTPARSSYEGPRYMVGRIGGKRVPVRSYIGSNAYGVTRRVQVVRLDEDGLAMLERPTGEVSPYASNIFANDPPAVRALMPPPDKNSYWLELALPGPAARKVAMDSTLEIDGTIAALEDGRPATCKGTFIEAEIDAPNEIYGSECWVGAHVQRIAFVRKSTGEVLKEWVK